MRITEPGTHLDHLLRQTRMHHVQLSSMADMKANILLTMSSVVLTLAIRYVQDPDLRAPTFTLMAACLVTIFLATYAVMPHLPFRKGRSASPVGERNMLFFGDFAGMSYEEYVAEMEELMSEPSRAYEAQVREIYSLGCFLAKKKFRFLRLAYCTILAGFLTCSVWVAAITL